MLHLQIAISPSCSSWTTLAICYIILICPLLVQMSVIMMNLFSGPPLFRSAIISAGEARAMQLPTIYNDTKSPT